MYPKPECYRQRNVPTWFIAAPTTPGHRSTQAALSNASLAQKMGFNPHRRLPEPEISPADQVFYAQKITKPCSGESFSSTSTSIFESRHFSSREESIIRNEKKTNVLWFEPPFCHIHLGLLIVFCKILAQICLLLRHSDYKSSDGATRMMQCKHSDLKTPNTRPTQCLRTLAASLTLQNVRRLKDLATNPHTYLCTSLLVLQCRYGIYRANYQVTSLLIVQLVAGIYDTLRQSRLV
ncbi:hypothetical protein I7I51_08174 [Histoplasma capsulatum]|uniref:Uncharacterized protein n=1 Tax=Ajellomyces capsulatus TaxID=5037 RepID=A0A8A1LZP0_AJECA|nr:hypothetical protein I7I51_08174 [Histoplasma capsulatum]